MKKIYHYLPAFFCMALLLASCSKKETTGGAVVPPDPIPANTAIVPPAPFGFYVVGYFPSYRNETLVPDVKFKMCSVVNYAFANMDSTGGLTIGNATHLLAVKNKAKANGAKVFLSISGLAADFKTAASTALGRTKMAANCMNLLRLYALDGLDIDWEFPRTDNGTNITYTSFMKQLSDSCHTGGKYYLTAAITAGKYAGAVRDAISDELLFGPYVDWFNIMSYDDFSTTVPYKHHTDINLVNSSFNYWVGTRNMPKSKAVLGMPAYGRPSGITQSGTVLSFNDILLRGGNPQSDSAVVSNGTFLNYTIYYNGIATVKKKAMLAKQMGNGVMMWEKSQDAQDNNSLLKAICDTIGRAY